MIITKLQNSTTFGYLSSGIKDFVNAEMRDKKNWHMGNAITSSKLTNLMTFQCYWQFSGNSNDNLFVDAILTKF